MSSDAGPVFIVDPLTEDDRHEMAKAVRAIDESALDERLRPFRTPPSSESFSRLIK